MTVLRPVLFGALALASSIVAMSSPANATRHHRSHILVADGPHIHKAHVLDAVARRQASPLHRSASLINRGAMAAGEVNS